MLILTRKLEESIVIGDDIQIVILAIDREKVKIGIKAPQHVPIMRKELQQALVDQEKIVVQIISKTREENFADLRSLLTVFSNEIK